MPPPSSSSRRSSPGRFYAQGQATLDYFTLSYIVLVLIFAIVFLYLLDSSILSPISRLSTDVKRIGMTRDLSARLKVGKEENEVSNLQENINKTLAALEKAQGRLQKSEEKNRALLSAVPDQMCQVKKEGIHEEFNATTAAELGAMALHELLGNDLEEIKEIFEVIPQGANGPEGGETENGEISPVFIFEYTVRGKGGVRYYEMRLVVSGKNEVLAIARDITDRKQAEEELERYRARLEESRGGQDPGAPAYQRAAQAGDLPEEADRGPEEGGVRADREEHRAVRHPRGPYPEPPCRHSRPRGPLRRDSV